MSLLSSSLLYKSIQARLPLPVCRQVPHIDPFRFPDLTFFSTSMVVLSISFMKTKKHDVISRFTRDVKPKMQKWHNIYFYINILSNNIKESCR